MATERICSMDGCGKPAKCIGLCHRHYRDSRVGKTVCSVDGCAEPVAAKGMCSAHYQRQRNNGSLTIGRAKPGTLTDWIHAHINWSSAECLEWPFARRGDGYGVVRREGKGMGAHHLMCILAHGDAPSPLHEVAHGCGNPGCVNPDHLRWATRRENHADKIIHGTSARGQRAYNNRLSEDDVRWIRENVGVITKAQMARLLSVSYGAVDHAAKGNTWAWLR